MFLFSKLKKENRSNKKEIQSGEKHDPGKEEQNVHTLADTEAGEMLFEEEGNGGAGEEETMTGYRCGDVGFLSGADPDEASVAWKVLSYEYKEMGNSRLHKNVLKFLGWRRGSWDAAVKEFRKRYGDAKGVWLVKSKRQAENLYGDYGDSQSFQYSKKDVVVDTPDGIFVLIRGQKSGRGALTGRKERRAGLKEAVIPEGLKGIR